ncbi:hypothetical protein PF011_g7005 [Phytophthora fragariae]|uniref:RxLR effector protein n=1 Tax=Phytophthora fragariae TaxID=53985 RepID=A0A6A3LBC6_9STRA|nr:hypothetical protein PF003_g6709 [Phytophthora fragariae]KAE9016752.1 hypothetical protein PF011_g7005 [Phytophthora fragariae]
MSVAPTLRFFLPCCMTASISAAAATWRDVRSFTKTPASTVSLSSRRFLGSGASRSRISSL